MKNYIKQATFTCIFMVLQFYALYAQPIKAIIYKDGSFNIVGKSVKIMGCYPALDNKQLRPLSIKITEKENTQTIQYNLAQGLVKLQFFYLANALSVHTTLIGIAPVNDLVSVIYNAEVLGAKQVYRTPVIIGGRAGIINWPDTDVKGLNCESITGFMPDSGATMVVSTRDYKKYISLVKLYPTEANNQKKIIDVGVSTEKVSNTNIPIFYFTENASAYNAMRTEAKAAADFMGVKNDKPQSYHWCSWYATYYHLTQNMVSDYLKQFKAIEPAINIQTFQIDAGYHPHIGDWLEPSTKFPNGIGSSVKEIITKGYKAGIWIGPYMVGSRSKLYAQHPDWILRKNDNTPIIQMKFYGEERLWGQMDEECYVLDTSNPAAMAYLRNVFRTFKQMGITFFKTDFMYYGWEGSHNVKRCKPGKTSSEYQREFFDMIREEIGSSAYWLGCIAPFPVMLGYVDGMRIAGDIGPKWDASIGMFNEMRGSQHINNIWWQNDSDAMILREQYNQLTEDETKTIAYWICLLGGVINTSDLFHEIPKSRVQLFRFLEPSTTKYTGYMPFITGHEKLEVVVRAYPDKKSFVVLFANRGNEKATSTFTLNSLVGLNSATCFNWDATSAQAMGVKQDLTIELNPHQSKLIYVSTNGKSPEGMTLGGKN
jgi:alpha-galactosidase